MTEQDLRVIAQAAEGYRQRGSPQVSVIGHTEISGSAAYNLELSQQHAAVVANIIAAAKRGYQALDSDWLDL